jgi:thiol:disulfide interchange protein DsbG
MKRFFVLFAALLVFLSTPALAQDATPLPAMPDPIKELMNQGAQVRYLGRDYNLDAWLTIKNGQEQYFYVLPDQSAFLMGVLFDPKGKVVTVQQVQRLQAQGDTLLDSLANGAEDPADQKVSKEMETPSEQLFSDIEGGNWLPLGQAGAPVAYAFIDPQCPHCHAFIADLRANYINQGKIQLRIIPVGFKEETMAQAAYLLATPNPQERLYRHMDGDTTAIPAKTDINQQGIERNLAIMHRWKFDVTPLIIYRAKDNSVKIVKGQPKDVPGFVADLGSRS